MKRKLLSVLLVLALALTLLPTAAFAEGMDLSTAGVEEITSVATIDQSDKSNISVSVNPANALEWVEANTSIGRGYDGWWIGFKAIAPSSVTKNNLSSVKYRNNGSLEDKTTFAASNDGTVESGNYYIQLWGGISTDILNQFVAAKRDTIQYVWYFNWDGDDNTGKTIAADNFKSTSGTATDMTGVDQVITLTFNLNDVTLKNQNGTQAWPQKAEGYETVGIANPNLTIYPDYANGANGPWDDEASATATAVTGELNKYNVAVTAKNLVEHKREGDATTGTNAGNWIGFTVPYDKTDTYKQGWGTTLGESFEDPDGIDGSKAGFYWNLTEQHKTNGDKGILEVTHGITKITYIVDFTNVSLYKAVTPTLTFGEANPDAECFTGADNTTKKVSDMGKFTFEVDKDDSNKIIVTGTATYRVQTGFNTAHTNEEKGHYLPIKITSNTDREITIINCSDGAKNGKTHTLTADAGYETLVWLDGKPSEYPDSSAKDLTPNTFTVDDYVIDFSGVALLPQATVDKATGTVTVDTSNSVDDLKTLIGAATKNEDDASATTNDAPVKVEVAADDTKTLTFAPKTNENIENPTPAENAVVTLSPALVTAVTGTDAKADVKVESAAGSVTIPSETVAGGDAKTKGVTITVKENTITASDELKVVTDDPSAPATTLGAAETKTLADATGVTVTAKTGSSTNLVTGNTTDAGKITVIIGGLTAGNYVVFCIKEDGTVTKVGPATVATDASTISVTSAHLTSFVAVAEADVAKSEALKNVPDDVGAKITDSTPETPTTTATYALTDGGIGKKVTVTGEANHYYVVQIGNSAPASIFCVKANGTTAEFYVANNDASKFKIWDAGTSAASFTGRVPTDLTQVDKA